jgi:hypothetical protein
MMFRAATKLFFLHLCAATVLAAGDRESVVFTGGREGYAFHRTPALVISGEGTVLAFCGGRVNDHREGGAGHWFT